MDSEREMAEKTLHRAREVLQDLIVAAAEHGPAPHLDETRADLEAEIKALEAVIADWDHRFGRPPGRGS